VTASASVDDLAAEQHALQECVRSLGPDAWLQPILRFAVLHPDTSEAIIDEILDTLR